MTIGMHVAAPSDVKVTLTCTMTVRQWQALVDTIGKGPPESDVHFFGNCIRDGIDKVRKNVLGDPRLL